MPYTKAEFNTEKQSKFKSALAIASGTTVDTVEIISISDVRRRQGQGIKVESKIYAKDAAGADKLSSTLGTGAGALDKINAELQKQGLPQSTGVVVDVVAAGRDNNTGVIVGVVVGCVGGGALIIGIAAYYLYVVKPGIEASSKDVQDNSIITSTSPVAPSRAFMTPPVASLGTPTPASIVFDAYDFAEWSKSGAPSIPTNQPHAQMSRFNV